MCELLVGLGDFGVLGVDGPGGEFVGVTLRRVPAGRSVLAIDPEVTRMTFGLRNIDKSEYPSASRRPFRRAAPGRRCLLA